MLKPSTEDPNYQAQMKRFNKDSSDWGVDHTKVDMLKEPHRAGSIVGAADAMPKQNSVGAFSEDKSLEGQYIRISMRLVKHYGLPEETSHYQHLVYPTAVMLRDKVKNEADVNLEDARELLKLQGIIA